MTGARFALFALLLANALPARAAVWYVDKASAAATPDGLTWATAYSAIQNAVDSAASGDEVWVAAGTYTGTAEQVVNLKEGVALYGGFAGTETARNQRNWTLHVTVIDGETSRRCVTSGAAGTLDGFTVQHGSAEQGAGMLNGTATNCIFRDNSALMSGGGMQDGTAGHCTFESNWAGSGGGMQDGTATDCTFTGCSATAYGGGMQYGTAVNCTFIHNTMTLGGSGAGMSSGTAAGCTFIENSAGFYGGGMYMGTATECTFRGNFAPNMGGGTCDSTAVNCVFTANDSYTGGGAYGGTLTNCTLTGNRSMWLGGAAYSTAVNCIIWGNSFHDFGGGNNVTYSCTAEAASSDGTIVADPGFVNPMAGDFRLRSDSPCVDAGTPTGAPATDFMGRLRPQGAGVDMGAYEFCAGDDGDAVPPPGPLRVNTASTATSPDGLTWETAFPTLRAAVSQAGYGSEVWVARGTYTADEGIEVVRLTAGVHLYGGFAGTETERDQRNWTVNRTVIDGDGLRSCVNAGTADSVDGFTLQNGKGPNSTEIVYGEVGGMLSGLARNCIFTGNTPGTVRFGKAVNCVFANNPCSAVMNGYAVNCTFVDNVGPAVMSGTAVNCIFRNNGSDVTADTRVSYSCLPEAATGEGNIVGDPLFVDAEAADYRLRPGSPCIDTATGDGAPDTDILGLPRPQGAGVDMGAHEGATLFAVPEVVGLPRAQAEAAIVGAGLALGIASEAHSDTVAEDSVISQDPESRDTVPPDTAVNLVISLGPAPSPEGEGEPVDAEAVRAQLAGVYGTSDTNDDGMLSFEEAFTSLNSLSQTTFAVLDANGDGQLSPDELGIDSNCGCSGCFGQKSGWSPFSRGKEFGDLFVLGLGLVGATALTRMRRP